MILPEEIINEYNFDNCLKSHIVAHYNNLTLRKYNETGEFSTKIEILESLPHIISYYSQYKTHNKFINEHVSSLSKEKLYNFLRDHIDEDQVLYIKVDNLLGDDNFGQTLLHLAAADGNKEVTDFLIKKTGIKLFNALTNIDKYTVLHLAVYGVMIKLQHY